ncbi:hypothetical protein C8R46DRAFT_545935 [Mycena filopes]|nr:hypothetical protein C8R46DRAFT_545935 [Mycena filopes]
MNPSPRRHRIAIGVSPQAPQIARGLLCLRYSHCAALAIATSICADRACVTIVSEYRWEFLHGWDKGWMRRGRRCIRLVPHAQYLGSHCSQKKQGKRLALIAHQKERLAVPKPQRRAIRLVLRHKNRCLACILLPTPRSSSTPSAAVLHAQPPNRLHARTLRFHCGLDKSFRVVSTRRGRTWTKVGGRRRPSSLRTGRRLCESHSGKTDSGCCSRLR